MGKCPIEFSSDDPLSRSRTKQEFAKESNINTIVAKAKITGILGNPGATRQPRFGDFSNGIDFQTVSNRIAEAQQSFMELPAIVRARFKNDVAVMLDFIADPANLSDCQALGLLPPPTPEEIRAVQEAEAASSASAGQAQSAPVNPA